MRRKLLEAYPNAQWYEYEPVNNDEQMRGATVAFGAAYRPQHSLDGADVIVSLDSDFLCNDPASTKLAREFAGFGQVAQVVFAVHLALDLRGHAAWIVELLVPDSATPKTAFDRQCHDGQRRPLVGPDIEARAIANGFGHAQRDGDEVGKKCRPKPDGD